ncbi:phosphatidylcholine transfer protein isoform X1 [Anomaloglossus baeobatrachus]|uniref:phosphatidylcholine transfer protein isoform X1 n=1 Tax=Anomaloglossus baeobatrachus TaxID=238106 RepID=UPI003F5001F4
MKTKIFEKLQSKDPYCLHFDGKRIQGEEYQVVLLKNTTTKIKLGILKCENGSATAIHKELHQLIDEYDAWENIRMIICDTAAVNTGRLNGIVRLIQDDVLRKGFQKPQYSGCQHHVLNLLLKHVMNFLIPESAKKPELNYFFIDKLTENYASLQIDYHQVATDDVNTGENPGWRDDFKFLYELCQAYRHYKTTARWPRISWKKLPNLHMARWNSRAVYAVIAFFLIPEWRRVLGIACDFIYYEWVNAWFQSQHYNKASFNELLTSLTKTKCKKAIKCLKAHWLVEESLIDIPRSNQNAKRAVKLMEELHAKSKKIEFLNLKFIGKNNF